MESTRSYWGEDCVRVTAQAHNSNLIWREPVPGRQRDRHSRGPRGPLLFPALPAWRTRKEQFRREIQVALGELAARVPAVETIEFGVEDMPPSDPAEWETHDVTMARVFPRDRKRGLNDRIVLYRRPISERSTPENLGTIIRIILAQRISEVLLVSPQDLLGH